MSANRFVIDAMPRTGSTSLASLLCCHPEISCLIEPFHPQRYRGQYNTCVKDRSTLRQTLDLIWLRWTGIKHVWQVHGQWPFSCESEVNEEIVNYAPAVISIERHNLLQRYVSSIISRQLKFWIGTRAEFMDRLERTVLPDFDPDLAGIAIASDRAAMLRRRELVQRHPTAFTFVYEDLYGNGSSQEHKRREIDRALMFLRVSPLTDADVATDLWRNASEDSIAKWHTPEVYERMPGIRRLEDQLGSDETGWLFR